MNETRTSLLMLALGNFAIGMGALVVAGILRPMSGDLRISVANGGQLITVYALGYALGSPLLVALTGRVRRKRLLLAGLALCALGNIGGALAPTFAIMVLTRVLAALGAGMFTPVASAVAAANSPPERRAQAIGLVFAGLTVATALGVPAGTFVGLHFGWRAALVMVAAVAVLGLAGVSLSVPGGMGAPVVDVRMWGRLLTRGAVLLGVAVTLLQSTAQFTVFTYISPLLTREVHVDATGITLALLLFGVASVAGTWGAGRLADGWGAARAVRLTLILLIPPLLAMAYLAGSLGLALSALAVWGAVGFGFNVPQQARLVLLAPTAAGATLAMNASALYMGTAAGSALGGVIVGAGDLSSIGLAGAGVAALALIVSFVSQALAGMDTRRAPEAATGRVIGS